MKRNSIYQYLGAAALAFLGIGVTSCSNNDMPDADASNPDALVLAFDVNLPQTRSTTSGSGTSDAGTETGNANESKINSIVAFFVDDTNKTILSLKDFQLSENSGIYTASIQLTSKYLANNFANKKVRLFVVANSAVTDLGNLDGTIPFPEVINYGNEGVVVPMSNESASSQINFGSADDIVNVCTQADGKINLSNGFGSMGSFGTITLQRTVARIDYKDKDRSANETANLYALGNTGMYLKIQQMQPVNVSRSSYIFRHTAEGTTAAAGNTVSLFGTEKGNVSGKYTWVVDNDWTAKKGVASTGYLTGASAPINPTGASGNLNADAWTLTADITGNNIFDNYKTKEYHPWCYVSENTLPSTDLMIEGLSTGVAFKVLVCDNAGEPLNSAKLSALGSTLNGMTLNLDNSTNVFTLVYNGASIELEEFVDGANTYYAMTYYYWIRHDNNSNPNVMGPMEFAVVRNNVYKLSIASINGLPRKYNSTDPDEPGIMDLNVNVKVDPWGYFKVEEEI